MGLRLKNSLVYEFGEDEFIELLIKHTECKADTWACEALASEALKAIKEELINKVRQIG